MIWDAEEFSYVLIDLSDKSTLHTLFIYGAILPSAPMPSHADRSSRKLHRKALFQRIMGLKRLSVLRIFTHQEEKFCIFHLNLRCPSTYFKPISTLQEPQVWWWCFKGHLSFSWPGEQHIRNLSLNHLVESTILFVFQRTGN